MPAKTSKKAQGLKTCSRGHRYRGARCPICWPGGVSKARTARATGGKQRA